MDNFETIFALKTAAATAITKKNRFITVENSLKREAHVLVEKCENKTKTKHFKTLSGYVRITEHSRVVINTEKCFDAKVHFKE